MASAPGPMVDLHPTVVHQWLASGKAVLVDVREPSEHRAEHITGSRLAPLSTFEPSSVPREEGKTVVLHCKSGKRSTTALNRLIEAGRTDVASMAGGIEAWKVAGLATQVDRNAPIDVMRQTQIVIGALVLTGLALGVLVSPWFLILSAIMGTGLVLAGSTGSCGMAMLIAKMPWNRASPG